MIEHVIHWSILPDRSPTFHYLLMDTTLLDDLKHTLALVLKQLIYPRVTGTRAACELRV